MMNGVKMRYPRWFEPEQAMAEDDRHDKRQCDQKMGVKRNSRQIAKTRACDAILWLVYSHRVREEYQREK
jgi:hypothetical protein